MNGAVLLPGYSGAGELRRASSRFVLLSRLYQLELPLLDRVRQRR
jgi:hypothetical protein